MNVLICDDDQYLRKMLKKVTSNNEKIDNIFTAADGIEAVKTAEEKSIDIALLDIDMPKLDGIEATKIISKATPKTYFVFITAHMEYAIDSFCVHPYDYLLKPIDIEGFERTLEELVDLIQKRSLNEKDKKIDKLAIKEDGAIYFVLMNDILYFEKIDREVLVHTAKNVYAINKTLRALEKDLNNSFIKTHQSFIVNKEKIKKIKEIGDRTYDIQFFDCKKKASLSRKKYERLKKHLSIL